MGYWKGLPAVGWAVEDGNYISYIVMSVRERRKVAENHVFHIKIGPNSEVRLAAVRS
jgi:hypothetical protein